MEKCKTKIVPKLVTNLQKETRKITKAFAISRIKKLKKELKKETDETKKADLQKRIKKLTSDKERKYTKKLNNTLAKNYTKSFCNPGCIGTLYQDEGLDIEELVSKNICKKDPECNKDKKNIIKFFEQERKNLIKNRKHILDEDSFFYGFNKTKKAKLIKDGALSGCALSVLPY